VLDRLLRRLTDDALASSALAIWKRADAAEKRPGEGARISGFTLRSSASLPT
jgi:hypothetical protein